MHGVQLTAVKSSLELFPGRLYRDLRCSCIELVNVALQGVRQEHSKSIGKKRPISLNIANVISHTYRQILPHSWKSEADFVFLFLTFSLSTLSLMMETRIRISPLKSISNHSESS